MVPHCSLWVIYTYAYICIVQSKRCVWTYIELFLHACWVYMYRICSNDTKLIILLACRRWNGWLYICNVATYIHAYICTQKCEQDSAKVIEALAIWYIQIELDVLSIHVWRVVRCYDHKGYICYKTKKVIQCTVLSMGTLTVHFFYSHYSCWWLLLDRKECILGI